MVVMVNSFHGQIVRVVVRQAHGKRSSAWISKTSQLMPMVASWRSSACRKTARHCSSVRSGRTSFTSSMCQTMAISSASLFLGLAHGVVSLADGLRPCSRCAPPAPAHRETGKPSLPQAIFARALRAPPSINQRARETASVEFGGFRGARDGARSHRLGCQSRQPAKGQAALRKLRRLRHAQGSIAARIASCKWAAITSGVRSSSSKRRTVRYSTKRVP